MYLDELNIMYQLAAHFVTEEGYELIHMNEQEVWLKNYDKKNSEVIRLTTRGFDWKNHLKKDIAIVFQQVKGLRKVLKGKRVEIHNVYVSTYPPVDDWEALKRPMKLKEKNAVKMNVYYLNREDFMEEFVRLKASLDLQDIELKQNLSEEDKELEVNKQRTFLTQILNKKQQEKEKVFSYGKPFFTYIIMVINILLFILVEQIGESNAINTLVKFGAKYNPAIIQDGEWWRIITSMFLHIGLLHLVMNMIAVYYLGTLVEGIYGKWRFLIIYFLAGVGGGIASFAFSINVSAGASGAIFGLFGALLFFGLNYKQIFYQTMGLNILIVLAINIVFGFSIQQIDMAAHLGGLAAGFIASSILHLPHKKNSLLQLFSFIFYIGLLYGLCLFGITNNENNQTYHLMILEEAIKEENYEETIDVATNALTTVEGEMDAIILFQRSFAYIKVGEIDSAIVDLEKSISIDPLPEAYYNLALLYYNKGKWDKAEENIKKAHEANPNEEGFFDLYEQITGEPVN
ncbi:rhomboid family intramembrane serine protease [Oceanobacillus senegalensis]|uniref:rhomboid family intramembrane serine protease n=1 Tax=Oceanobacillus senegalensis TaxID=1936063 RepID=UPI000A3085D1|nr:rhomboid family intramembrane serine protease [Oceanobacillus senegalensis]